MIGITKNLKEHEDKNLHRAVICTSVPKSSSTNIDDFTYYACIKYTVNSLDILKNGS